MAVLVTAETQGVTDEMHDRMLATLGEQLRGATGFIAHIAGPHEGGWRVMEVWESKEAATEWFARFVHPNLPQGVKPRRTFHEVHAVVVRKPL